MEQYRDYLNSAMLANVSYNENLYDIWFNTKDSIEDSNEDNIFRGVKEVPEFYTDNQTGAYAFSIVKENTLYFVFRGTNDSQDIMTDLNFFLVPFVEANKKCKIHAGFLSQFTVLKNPVLMTVLNHKKNKMSS